MAGEISTLDLLADPFVGAAAWSPTAQGRPSGSAATVCRTEWRTLSGLAAIADDWQALARRALEPNVFYEPGFVLAAAPVFGRDVGAVLVWCGNEPHRLLGLFPLRLVHRRYGLRFPLLVGWTHPYAPLGVPLVDRERAGAVIAAALDFIAADPALPDLLLLPLIAAQGAVISALGAELFRRGGGLACAAQHARAMLAPAVQRADHLDHMLGGRKRRQLRRLLRRLGEQGELSLITATEAGDMGAAMDAFLALEMAGWKGRAGTAAAQEPAVRQFVQRAISALAERRQARIDRYVLDGRTIAAAIVLRSGGSAWFWKIAYAEDVAQASPGVQLAVHLTRALLADSSLGQVDSCAPADHPMIDHLWRERLDIADYLIAVRPKAAGKLAVAARCERLRRAGIAAARWLRGRVVAMRS